MELETTRTEQAQLEASGVVEHGTWNRDSASRARTTGTESLSTASMAMTGKSES